MKPCPERTEDVAFIRSVITHPRVWPWVSEDGQRPEDYQPLISPLVHYLRLGDAGVVSFYARGAVMFEGHVAMLPKVRSDEFVRAAIAWMWENTPAQKLICKIPAPNRHAIWYAMRAGFRVEGRITNAFLKNSALHDLVVLGKDKPCHQQ